MRSVLYRTHRKDQAPLRLSDETKEDRTPCLRIMAIDEGSRESIRDRCTKPTDCCGNDRSAAGLSLQGDKTE
jgi:hypothetical protein